MVVTFKIITLAAALEEQKINLFEDTFSDSGSINVDGSTLHCWKSGGHGHQTMLDVVKNSCNPGFVSIGLDLGTETLMNYIHEFGFGTKTGVDLNGESSGILFKTENMGLVETATTAFGQGISVTPLQQVTAVSAVINGGYLYTPYVVKGFLESETDTLIKGIEPVLKKQVINEETSSLVRFALESVVANGTGRNAYIENYRVGGKTGTAQTVENGVYSDSNYILSFIGFMPADDPEIVVYVAIQNAKNVVQYGGTVSAPIARNILISAADILDIAPSKEVMPKEYNWLDIKYLILPDVTGFSVEDAQDALNGFSIEYVGSGDKIIYQSPNATTYVKEGSTVVLMLG